MEVTGNNFSWKPVKIFPWKTLKKHVKITKFFILRRFSRDHFVLGQNKSYHQKGLEMKVTGNNFSWKSVKIFPWKTREKALKIMKIYILRQFQWDCLVLEQKQLHYRKALKPEVIWKKKFMKIFSDFPVENSEKPRKIIKIYVLR